MKRENPVALSTGWYEKRDPLKKVNTKMAVHNTDTVRMASVSIWLQTLTHSNIHRELNGEAGGNEAIHVGCDSSLSDHLYPSNNLINAHNVAGDVLG